MASVEYDPAVIQEFANLLYRRAASVIATYTFLGVFGGAILGGGAGSVINRQGDAYLLFSLLGAVLFGLIGYGIGSARAFMLKLYAQIALCAMEIEENTRSPH